MALGGEDRVSRGHTVAKAIMLTDTDQFMYTVYSNVVDTFHWMKYFLEYL